MGIATQLRTIDQGFATVASFPELKRTPIVIGESDPEGCAACQGPQLAYRNGTMYSSYTAASFARTTTSPTATASSSRARSPGPSSSRTSRSSPGSAPWPRTALDLPVLNVFRMFSRMGGDRLAARSTAAVPLDQVLADGVRGAPDVSALASRDGNRVSVLVWHYHDDDVPGPAADVRLEVSGLPLAKGTVRLTHYRIDEMHSNSYAAWKRMGSPAAPRREEYARLERAGRLAELEPAADVDVEGGTAVVAFALPRQAVSLLVLDWAPPGDRGNR